jgi:hypothetical protein
MQHPDKTHAIYIWKNNWNIENKNLQRTCTTIATYATYRYTFATFTWYTCDIQMKHLKHLKHTFTTCVSNAQCHLTPWRITELNATGAHGARWCASGQGPGRWPGWAPAQGARAPLGKHLLHALGQTEASRGMAGAATCRSGLAGSLCLGGGRVSCLASLVAMR